MICPCGAVLLPGAASCWVCGATSAPNSPFCRKCGVALAYRGGRQPEWCAEHRVEYQREYQRRPDVVEKRRRPEARPPEPNPIREALIRITEEMPPFTAAHRLAVEALALGNGAGDEALRQIAATLHPSSEAYAIANGALATGGQSRDPR